MSQQKQTITGSDNPEIAAPEAVLADQPFRVYLKLVTKPTLLAFLIFIIAEFTEVFPYFDWLVLFGLFSYLGVAAAIKKLSTLPAIIAGGLSGASLGFLVAFFRFVVHLKFPLFFRLITEPISLAVIGLCLAGAACWLVTEGRLPIRMLFPKK